jgi:hypothetical protein
MEETNFIAPKLHWWPELCNRIIQNVDCACKSLIPVETIFNDENVLCVLVISYIQYI